MLIFGHVSIFLCDIYLSRSSNIQINHRFAIIFHFTEDTQIKLSFSWHTKRTSWIRWSLKWCRLKEKRKSKLIKSFLVISFWMCSRVARFHQTILWEYLASDIYIYIVVNCCCALLDPRNLACFAWPLFRRATQIDCDSSRSAWCIVVYKLQKCGISVVTNYLLVIHTSVCSRACLSDCTQ